MTVISFVCQVIIDDELGCSFVVQVVYVIFQSRKPCSSILEGSSMVHGTQGTSLPLQPVLGIRTKGLWFLGIRCNCHCIQRRKLFVSVDTMHIYMYSYLLCKNAVLQIILVFMTTQQQNPICNSSCNYHSTTVMVA